MNHAEFDKDLKDLYAEAWWGDTGQSDTAALLVRWDDVAAYIGKLKEEHRMELSDMSQIVYADGLHDGQNQ